MRSLVSVATLAMVAGTVSAQTPPVAPPAPPLPREAARTEPVGSATTAMAPAPVVAGKPAAVVNGEGISLAEVEAILKQRPAPASTPLSDAQLRQMRHEVVGMLIDDHLMQQFLRAKGPPIADAEIAKWFVQLEASLKTQGHTLQEFYKERGLTEEQVRHSVTNMLQWTGYVKCQLSEEELQRYFERNREFFEQVTVRASHVVLRVPATSSDAERQAARGKLQALRQEIAAGKLDFIEAARQHSQCPSAANGGDIGFFPRKFAVEENFARASFALKVGELSDVVETSYGLHLLKATDRKAGQPADFAKMKEEVREVATHEMYLNLLADLRKSAKIEVLLESPPLKTPGPAAR